jgi:hypothetical protein
MTLHHWPNPRVPWRSFHNHWIVRLVEYLNQGVLPKNFQARPTELIIGIEPDILLLQDADTAKPHPSASRSALAEATLIATLPAPADLPFVGVYSSYDTSRLVAVIELVSPGNKDRPEARHAFTEKLLFLLHEGVHVMVIDVISLPATSIRETVLQRLRLAGHLDYENGSSMDEKLWLSSYCSLPAADPQPHLQVKEWAYPTAVSQPLPSLPLFLHTDQLWVSVDLQQTYSATIEAGRYRPS